MSYCNWGQPFSWMVPLKKKKHFILYKRHSAFLCEKWASPKDALVTIRRSQLFLHIYILIFKYSQALPWLRNSPALYLGLHALPKFSDKLLLMLLFWYPSSEHCGLCLLFYEFPVLSYLPHVFHHYTFPKRGKKFKI